MSNDYDNICSALRHHSTVARAKVSQRFFKTEPGQYGYGDVFIGVTVPQLRLIAKQYQAADNAVIKQLLHSKIHEERLLALFILVAQYTKADVTKQKQIFECYVRSIKYINNWDLVDSSAEHIVGAYLYNKDKRLLYQLAGSKNIWERRIAILATFHYIKQGDCTETLKIAKLLLNDSHDLIHKAVGWMLREVGKRCSPATEIRFLEQHYRTMPRTMLRYAVERFPKRQLARFKRV